MERTVRLEEYLGIVRGISSEHEKTFIDVLESKLESLKKDLNLRITAWTSADLKHQTAKLPIDLMFSSIDNYLLKQIKHIHDRLLDLLPKPGIDLLQYSFLSSIFGDKFYSDDITIAIKNEMYQYSIERFESKNFVLETDKVTDSVVSLPYIEIKNPLMWVLLTHEYGHYIDDKEKLSKKDYNSSLNSYF